MKLFISTLIDHLKNYSIVVLADVMKVAPEFPSEIFAGAPLEISAVLSFVNFSRS